MLLDSPITAEIESGADPLGVVVWLSKRLRYNCIICNWSLRRIKRISKFFVNNSLLSSKYLELSGVRWSLMRVINGRLKCNTQIVLVQIRAEPEI